MDGVYSLFSSPSGETCLHQAAALGQRTICHYIVEAGASLMKTDQQVSRPAGGQGIHRAPSRPFPSSVLARGPGGELPLKMQSCPTASRSRP